MIWIGIFACVLALVAVGCAGAALIISSRLTRAQASLQTSIAKSLSERLRKLDDASRSVSSALRELELKSPTKLAAEVAELSDAVQRLAATHQRFAGRFHATKHRDEPRTDDVAAADPEIAAMLSLQAAPVPQVKG